MRSSSLGHAGSIEVNSHVNVSYIYIYQLSHISYDSKKYMAPRNYGELTPCPKHLPGYQGPIVVTPPSSPVISNLQGSRMLAYSPGAPDRVKHPTSPMTGVMMNYQPKQCTIKGKSLKIKGIPGYP